MVTKTMLGVGVTGAAAIFVAGLLAAAPAQGTGPPPPAATSPPGTSPPAGTTAPQGVPPPSAGAPAAAPAPAEDAGRTAAGAIAAFMSSRDYRTIRELKAIMTPALSAAYDHDTTPFNGKKGYRLSAFDYREPAPKPGATSCVVTVKDLWDDQGEAVELRTENVRLTRDGDLWRAAALQKTASEALRYHESIAGVTTLRMVLRAWMRRDFDAARPLVTDACLKKSAGSKGGLEAFFAGDPAVRRAAFRILEMTPDGTTRVKARVRLVETPPGRPSPLDGDLREFTLVKKGPRWLIDDWQ